MCMRTCNESEKDFTLFRILRAACNIFKGRKRSLCYHPFHEEASRTELPFLDWILSFQDGERTWFTRTSTHQKCFVFRVFVCWFWFCFLVFFWSFFHVEILNYYCIKGNVITYPKEKGSVFQGLVYARLTWSCSLSSTRAVVFSFNFVRISPKCENQS